MSVTWLDNLFQLFKATITTFRPHVRFTNGSNKIIIKSKDQI